MRKRLVILDKRGALIGVMALVLGLLGLFGLVYWGTFHHGSAFMGFAELGFFCIGILILLGIVGLAGSFARVERD